MSVNSFQSFLFIGFLSFFTAVFEEKIPSVSSEYIAPPNVAMCYNIYDLKKYREENTNAVFTAVSNGNWDAGATWNQGGAVPGLNDAVIIPAGRTVFLNNNNNAKNITVNGVLRYRTLTQNFHLQTEWLLISGASAILNIGTATNRYTGQGTITLLGTKDNQNIAGLGDKFVGAASGGKIYMHGKNTISWSQLGANATAGSNTITLKEAVTWPVGAQIVVVSSRKSWNEAEKRTITAVSANGMTLTLNTPLTYPHVGVQKTYTRTSPAKTWTADLRAEVGLLSKNITVQGGGGSVTNGFGGHMMIHFGCKAFIDGVELFRMGQKAELGRYPFHWHLVKNGGAGQYFKNSSIHTSYNRAITIHGTESTLVEGNFCYDHLGHGIFLEDGGERYNTIKRNVVLLSTRPAAGQELTPSDNELNQVQNRTPSSFWITNPNNIFEDNVAAGTHGTGYWFAFPEAPMGDSGSDPYFNGIQPHKEPLGKFLRNKAHSCMSGFDIFDRLNPNHSIKANWGWDNNTLHYMDQCTWYANDVAVYAGIGVGGRQDNVIYRNNIFVENKEALFLATYNIAEQCVFVAKSGENLYNGQKVMYATYDGAGTVRNSHIVGWSSGTGVNLIRRVGAATKHMNHKFYGITKDVNASLIINYPDHSAPPPPNLGANDILHPRVWNMVLRDVDGSFGGTANTSIVTNHPLHLTGGEFQAPNWTNAYRSPHKFGLVWLWYPGVAMSSFPDVSMMRTKPGTPDAGCYYINGYTEKHQLPVIVNDGFINTYRYQALPSGKRIQVYFDDTDAGDHTILRFKDFGKLGGFFFSGVPSRSSLANLTNTNALGYYREPNGDVYFKPFATGLTQVWTMGWLTNFSVPVVDSDGDGSSDVFEMAEYRNPFNVFDFGFQFKYNGNFEGWGNMNNVSGGTVANNILSGTSSSNDPMVFNNDFNFEAADIQTITVRMRSSTNNIPAQIFWGRNDAPGFAGTRVATKVYSGGGAWQNLEFDVGSSPEWINNIINLRLDPVNSPGVFFEIDWIIASPADPCFTTATLNFPGVVPAGLHQANTKITSTGTVLAGGGTTFESGIVEMEVGFEAQPGSNFEARIGCQ